MSRVPRSDWHINYFHWKFLRFAFVRPANRAQLFALVSSVNTGQPLLASSLIGPVNAGSITESPPGLFKDPPSPPPSATKRCLPNDTESDCRTFQHPSSRAGTRLQGHSPCARHSIAASAARHDPQLLLPHPSAVWLTACDGRALRKPGRAESTEGRGGRALQSVFLVFVTFLTCFSGDRCVGEM